MQLILDTVSGHICLCWKPRGKYGITSTQRQGKWKSLSHVRLCDPMDYSPWNSPGQNTRVGSRSLLQGIFPTQGLNPGLPHCRRILHQLSHQGSPRILEWVAYPFSNGSSQPRNWTRVSCIAGGFFTNWATSERSKVAQSCPTLCDPMDCNLPGSSVHGIFQATVLEWVAISFSRGSSRPRDQTRVSRIVDRHFTIWATREVLERREQNSNVNSEKFKGEFKCICNRLLLRWVMAMWMFIILFPRHIYVWNILSNFFSIRRWCTQLAGEVQTNGKASWGVAFGPSISGS